MDKKVLGIRPALDKLQIGTSIDFPIEQLNSVRATASMLGVINDRQYTTQTNRTKRVITVTRQQ